MLAASILTARKRYQWGVSIQAGLHGSVLLLYFVQISFFLHEKVLLSTVLPISSVMVILAIVHLWYDRIIMVRRAELEKQTTKDRIARDLHDDIASTLSSARIYVDALRRAPKEIQQSNPELLQKIGDLLTEASDALTDIVWTVTHRQDTLGDMLARLRIQISDTCKPCSLTCSFDIEVEAKELELSDTVTRNLYLIFKEGIRNVVKHAKASSVSFRATVNEGILKMVLTDDGVGFPRKDRSGADLKESQETHQFLNPLHGHGLLNMKSRADDIGAILNIESLSGKGTTISVSRKMT